MFFDISAVDVRVAELMFSALTTFVRSYPAKLDFSLTLSDFDSNISVATVKIPSMNYNVSLFFSADGNSSLHDIAFSFDEEVLAAGLEPSESMNLTEETIVSLPKDVCPSAGLICALVLPASGASYCLASDKYSRKCVDITYMKNCDGEYLVIFLFPKKRVLFIFRNTCQ